MLSAGTFREYLFTDCQYQEGASLLAAVSGGLDSVVLVHLLHSINIPFGIAHVNYGLRGKESEEDEKFVAELAKKNDVPFILKKCVVEDFSETGENSIQFSARKIRYQFFETTALQHGYSFVATAHHLDDSIETALLNFARGTGVAGLRSIQSRKEKIIRPLLFANRTEILAYANANNISWREDSSNETDNYSRNRFRHHLLPWLMSQIPQGYSGFESSFSKLSATEEFISASLLFWQKKCCEFSLDELKISIDKMNEFPQPELFLKFFLQNIGFNDTQLSSLPDLLEGKSGTQLFLNTSRLIRDRNHLFLIPSNGTRENFPKNNFDIKEEIFTGQITSDDFSAIVDAKSIHLPLLIRQWKPGDKMIPFGMKGHRNVSDILNDLKLPLHKKEVAPVVVSNEEIVWIPGYRIADKFKVTDETSSIFKLSYNE
jgi:tRNA(Ile)-lysidine synthase